MREAFAKLQRGSRVLTWAGAVHAVLALVALALMPLDQRTILGVDPWLKPFKFMVSLAVYEWTVAWFLAELGSKGCQTRLIAWGAAFAMIGETPLLWIQSARGTTSHFNDATPFDGIVFASMGILILINTLMAAWLFVLYLVRRPELHPAVLWGIRLGLLVFLVGSVQGGVMIAQGAHTVGAPDGGPGLPLVNWSVEAGDLRIAHALGLHGLQVLPLIGYALAAARRSALWLAPVAALWLAFLGALHLLAQSGRPLL